jgi:chemotaxis response regulator CheB
MHILIANDSPSFRKEAREIIETIPFVSIVEEAKSGKEAIEFVKKHHPDFVLMDILMLGTIREICFFFILMYNPP